MVIFQILLLNDKRVISKERNTVRASNPRASLTWTDNTSKVGYESSVKSGIGKKKKKKKFAPKMYCIHTHFNQITKSEYPHSDFVTKDQRDSPKTLK